MKQRKILLVDDEPALLEMIKGILLEAGYANIQTASSFKEAVALFERFQPELAILDVNLPDGSGFDLMAEWRKSSEVPVLFLTARGDAEDKFFGLGLGADDYLVKPFLPKELTLRIGAVLRRTYKEESPLVRLAASTVDLEKAEVAKNGEVFQLTAKEHALLSTLARNANRITTLDSLCQAVWGDSAYGYENTLMSHIRRIREKIEAVPSKPVSLVTVKGLGYKLNVVGL